MPQAFLPLLAMLLPRWLDIVGGRGTQSVRKVIYLVSGASTPRNPDHRAQDNSTESCAKLAEMFIRQFFREVEVHVVNSGDDILHYEDNGARLLFDCLPVLHLPVCHSALR